jgi:hypothetical protein
MNFRLTHVLASVAILVLGASFASAQTIWTIDPTRSSITLNVVPLTLPANALFPGSPPFIGGDIDASSLAGPGSLLGIRNEASNSTWGTSPDPAGAPPGNHAILAGTIGTNYSDGSTIQFIGGASNNIQALTPFPSGGVYSPNPATWNPNLYGVGVGGFVGLGFVPNVFGAEGFLHDSPATPNTPVAFVSQQNVLLDLQSGALGINGLNQFNSALSAVGIKQSDFAILSLTNQQNGITDTYDVGTNTSAALVLTNSAGGAATIANLGGNLRQLTYNIGIPLAFLPVGSFGFIISETGTIVATTTIPEPSTMMLAGMGLIGLAICARRRFRRS